MRATNLNKLQVMSAEDMSKFLTRIARHCEGRRNPILCKNCPLQPAGACNEEFLLDWLKKNSGF